MTNDPEGKYLCMNQLSIFEFVQDEKEKPNDVILSRLQYLFPDWEVLGYVRSWEWGKYDDYSVVIHRDGMYKMAHAELYHDGYSRMGWSARTDFEFHWFKWYEERDRHWAWRSLEDRNRVFEIAINNGK
jgi:hypothetical protein